MSLSRSSKDVLSGTSGGIAQVFVGQPLDIIKVRLQTAQKGTYTGLVDCASQIFKSEGPLGFYRVCLYAEAELEGSCADMGSSLYRAL